MAMSVEEAQAALDAANAVKAAATTMKEKIAAGKEVAAAQRELTAAKAAARAQERADAEAAAAAKAEAERPKTAAEMAEQLMGVRPIIGPGESPDVVGGAGFPGYVQYKPLDEQGLRAVYGYNPATGKAYTPEESAAASGGYLYGADQGGAVGYELDPRTGQMNVLYKSGMVATSGATYKYTPQGYVVPSDKYMENFPGFGYDDYGRMINAKGGLITQADIDTYNGLVAIDPQKAKEFARGKGMSDSVANSGTPITATATISPTSVNTVKSAGGASVSLSTGSTATGSLVTGTPTATTMTPTQTDTYSIILDRLNKYNLGSLAPLIRKLAIEGATEATIMLALQDEPLYQERFKANQARREKGLKVLSPVEYLTLEDDYRQVLRAYGLNQFDNDAYVSQFIQNDMSVSELSNRVVSAVQRVRNADPAISSMLRNYYGIGQNDLVAYVLDPSQQFQKIERQIAAAEIGVAAGRQGIQPGVAVSEQLAAQGISQAEAQKGYATIADILPTAQKLSDIYGKTLEGYGLAEAEQEVFNQLASAQRKRQQLTQREVAAFSGQAGLGRTSLTQQTGGQF